MENNKYIKNNSFRDLKIKKFKNFSDILLKIKLILSDYILKLNTSEEKKSEMHPLKLKCLHNLPLCFYQ